MRTFKGKIVSDRMDKAVVVEVSRLKKHPKYERRFKISKKYKVDDPGNDYKGKVGEEVVIAERSPVSRHKRWKIVSK